MRRDSRESAYFLPFEIVTIVAITMDTIEASANSVVLFLQPHPLIPKLEQILQSRPAPGRLIDDSNIRLKVALGRRTFFVDAKGTVQEQSAGRTFALTKTQRQQIEQSVTYFRGVVVERSRE